MVWWHLIQSRYSKEEEVSLEVTAQRKESVVTSPLEPEYLGFEQKSAFSEKTVKETVSSGEPPGSLWSRGEGTEQN